MIKKLISESLGTFFLVFLGTGAVVLSTAADVTFHHLAVAFAFGIAVAVGIFLFAKTSGANFNPAISIALFIKKEIDLKHMLSYIAAQVAGALLASLTLLLIVGNIAYLGTAQPGTLGFPENIIEITWYGAFIAEFLMAFLLVLTVLGIAVYSRATKSFAGAAIGCALFLGILIVGPISGAALNPARALAPALVTQNFSYLWIYLTAPILGGIAAALLSKFIFEGSEEN